jgi:hypothetical protein
VITFEVFTKSGSSYTRETVGLMCCCSHTCTSNCGLNVLLFTYLYINLWAQQAAPVPTSEFVGSTSSSFTHMSICWLKMQVLYSYVNLWAQQSSSFTCRSICWLKKQVLYNYVNFWHNKAPPLPTCQFVGSKAGPVQLCKFVGSTSSFFTCMSICSLKKQVLYLHFFSPI